MAGSAQSMYGRSMYAPEGYRPEEVCEIRDAMVKDLHGPMAKLLADWENVAHQLGKWAPTTAAVELAGFDTARLFWVPPEETQAIVEGSEILPDDLSLTLDLLPSISGFVVFGGNWAGIDANTGKRGKFYVRAIRWGPVKIKEEFRDDEPRGIAISSYSTSRAMNAALAVMSDEDMDSAITNMGLAADAVLKDDVRRSAQEHEGKNSWIPLGRSDWILGDNWKYHPAVPSDAIAYSSVIEDRRVLVALWGLMESCPPQDLLPNRAERRRAARRGTEAAPVRVVTWRGPRGETLASDGSEGTGRTLTKRFPVKAHWRHQPYGEGRKKRKWILIPKHWRGPEDGEIADPHEIIHKVVQR